MATSTPSKSSTTVLTPALIGEVSPRSWSVRNADKGLAAVKTPQQAAAYAAGAIKVSREAGDLMQVAAAYATAAMLKQGMAQKDIAVALGKAESTVTQYKRLGQALNLGITPETEPETWTGLGSGGGGTSGDVGKVLAKKDATVADVKTAVAEFVAEKSAKQDAKDTGNGDAKQDKRAPKTAKDTVPEGMVKEPRENPARLDMIEKMLDAIESGRGLSPKGTERLQGIADRIHGILHPEDAAESA